MRHLGVAYDCRGLCRIAHRKAHLKLGREPGAERLTNVPAPIIAIFMTAVAFRKVNAPENAARLLELESKSELASHAIK